MSELDLSPLLYPELYSEEERAAAEALLSERPEAQASLEQLRSLQSTLNDAAGAYAEREGSRRSRTSAQRSELLEVARQVAAERRSAQSSAQAPLSAWLLSPQLAWLGVISLALVSLWQLREPDFNELKLSRVQVEPLSDDMSTTPAPQVERRREAKGDAQGESQEEAQEADKEETQAKERAQRELNLKTVSDQISAAKQPAPVEAALAEAAPSGSSRLKDKARKPRKTRRRPTKRSRPRKAKKKPRPIPPKRSRGGLGRSSALSGASKSASPRAQAARAQAPRAPIPSSEPASQGGRVYRQDSAAQGFGGLSPTEAPVTEEPNDLALEAESLEDRAAESEPPGRAAPSAPWAEALRLDQGGQRREALKLLERWLTRNMSHPRALEASRLGARWAESLSDQVAKRRFIVYDRALRGGASKSSPSARPKRKRAFDSVELPSNRSSPSSY